MVGFSLYRPASFRLVTLCPTRASGGHAGMRQAAGLKAEKYHKERVSSSGFPTPFFLTGDIR
jgi:hypothetical protein